MTTLVNIRCAREYHVSLTFCLDDGAVQLCGALSQLLDNCGNLRTPHCPLASVLID